MSTAIETATETTAAETPLTPAQLFEKTKAERGQAPVVVVPPSDEPKRPSGDERKFQRRLQRAEQKLRDEFDAKLAALAPKPAAQAEAATDTAPKREDFASDEEYQDARVDFKAKQATEKLLKERDAESAQTKTVQDAVDGYNERMQRGPLKYEDWDETMERAPGKSLDGDLSKDCPALFWAITISPYNDDILYAWMKDSSKLQKLIDQYKANPEEAIAAFHRFEGRVGKDEIPEKKAKAESTPKADDAGGAKKPKPTSEVTVQAGRSAPVGAPEMYLKGTHTLNPEWKVWNRARNARN